MNDTTSTKHKRAHAPDPIGGLWRVEARQSCHGANTAIVAGDVIVAVVPGRGWDPNSEPRQGDWRFRANAYAMASARNMMDALRDAVSFLSGFEDDETQPEAAKLARHLRQVLADATPPEFRDIHGL